MNILKISYPTPLSQVFNKEDENIDVFVELEDGSSLTVVVSTPLNLLSQMNNDNTSFVPTPYPEVIVKSLTEENIKQAIEELAKGDAFWLKLLYVASVDRDAIDMERVRGYLRKIKDSNNELVE